MRLDGRSLGEMIELGAWIGDRYRKRLKEEGGRFVPVDAFVADELLKHLETHPEALPSVSHDEFERLCAELFVRRGFKVDLFRPSKDGGVDFLAVQDDGDDPLVFAVQCKQPETRPDGSRRTVGRPILQQVYGASKAWDLSGAALISGSTYSREARSFAGLKPTEMLLYNQDDLLGWIQTYRWNSDE